MVLRVYREGWGLPTHEAMVMGLPVITTDWGGSTEFVKQGSGLLVRVDIFENTEGGEWSREC